MIINLYMSVIRTVEKVVCHTLYNTASLTLQSPSIYELQTKLTPSPSVSEVQSFILFVKLKPPPFTDILLRFTITVRCQFKNTVASLMADRQTFTGKNPRSVLSGV